ncbi:MAG: flavohemoglobin expression-modulating QEGLA motif protein [Gammaproteobacteria bacterium]
MTAETRADIIGRLADDLAALQKPIRVLHALSWPESIADSFLASGGAEPPAIDSGWYARERPLSFDADALADDFSAYRETVRADLGDDPVAAVLTRNAAEYWQLVQMLAARGTPAFHQHSAALYGSPRQSFDEQSLTLRELGSTLAEIIEGMSPMLPPGPADLHEMDSQEVVDELDRRFRDYFHDDTPHVKLDDGIVADAAAGSDYVKIREGASFTRRDVDQLEVHEGWVHIGTTLNGLAQPVARWLAKGPPCTVEIQEGLAVLMEMLTFRMTPGRARKLNDRIVACDMAEQGTDFRGVFRYFCEQGLPERDAFRQAQRIFRGGTIDGGVCFTKDIVYMRGFVRIYNFLRSAIKLGRPDLVQFLFAGKVMLDDLPLLAQMHADGLLDAPRHVPAPFADPHGLATWLAYSNFFNRVELSRVHERYRVLIAGDTA